MNLIYDFAEDRDTKTYMALVDSLLAPFVLVFILGIGALIRNGDYITSLNILGLSLFIGILILQFVVRDPKHKDHPSIYTDGFSS